ncbi:MAG: hypothetical protein R3F11_30200 [Verrucomicrobiales bacterium]
MTAAAAPSAKIVALRELLRERFPEAQRAKGRAAPEEAMALGIASLEAAGVLRGSITEIAGPPGSGGALVIAGVLEKAAAAPGGGYAALIDAADAFDPPSFGEAACARLLWLRCRGAAQALKAADLILRDGNLPLALLDLQFSPERELAKLPSAAWFRLRQLAERGGTALLALTPKRLIPAARLRLSLGGKPISIGQLEAERAAAMQAVQLAGRDGRARREAKAG